jgi:ABC-2 type transport system permease protein
MMKIKFFIRKLNKVTAFIKKDFYIESSYKLAFILGNINSLFPVVLLFFVGRMIVGTHPHGLVKYGGDYFSFSLIGIAFTTYFTISIQTFSDSMRRAQMAGCLEAILSSQTSSRTIVFLSSIYSFISAGISTIIIFVISIIFFGFDISKINIASTFVSLLLSLTTFISLGIFSAAGTIIFKKGEPFGIIFGTISSVLGGVVYPVSSLPLWLQHISYIVPITHSFEALRLSILQGYSIDMILKQLLILGSMSIVLFPLSLWFFNWTVEKGKKDGSLIQY